MAKTMVDIDRDLVSQASAALGGVSMKDAVHEGLRRVVREAATERLAQYFGNLDQDQTEALKAAKDSW